MKKIFGIVGLTVGATMMVAGAAMALDSSFDALSKSGKHQFYVWCTGGKSHTDSADGANAKEAQAALAAKAGDSCWPVWQGLAG
jgi:hypothetical protein